MNALQTLVRPFVEITLHRAGPENLPASRFLLGLVVVVHVLLYTAAMYLLEYDAPRAVAMPFVDAIAQGVFFGALLTVMGFGNRVLQTLTAAFGADVVLNFISVSLAVVQRAAGDTSPVALVLWLGTLGVLLWSLGVKGHILHRAVGLPYFVGVTIAAAFAVALYALDQSVFGA